MELANWQLTDASNNLEISRCLMEIMEIFRRLRSISYSPICWSKVTIVSFRRIIQVSTNVTGYCFTITKD